jgi:hypothetical protein
MVMGLLPVVGVPLPLISYGGTAMLTVMFGVGVMMSVYVHPDLRLGRGGGDSADRGAVGRRSLGPKLRRTAGDEGNAR